MVFNETWRELQRNGQSFDRTAVADRLIHFVRYGESDPQKLKTWVLAALDQPTRNRR
jgi:hypothetical protein